MTVVSEPGEGERLIAGPTVTIVKVPGNATGGRLGVVEMHLQADWPGPPSHVHEEVEHCWYVLEGSVTLTIDDDTSRFGPGSCLFVPAGTPHAFSTADGPAAVVLQVDSPRPLDDYFRELAAAFPPGEPVDPAEVADIMRRHDTTPTD